MSNLAPLSDQSIALLSGGVVMVEPRILKRTSCPRPRIGQVIAAACTVFDRSKVELLCYAKTAPLVRHRQIAMHVAREMCGRSYPIIATAFKRRDHTTILHADRRIKALIADGDKDTMSAVAFGENLIR